MSLVFVMLRLPDIDFPTVGGKTPAYMLMIMPPTPAPIDDLFTHQRSSSARYNAMTSRQRGFGEMQGKYIRAIFPIIPGLQASVRSCSDSTLAKSEANATMGFRKYANLPGGELTKSHLCDCSTMPTPFHVPIEWPAPWSLQ